MASTTTGPHGGSPAPAGWGIAFAALLIFVAISGTSRAETPAAEKPRVAIGKLVVGDGISKSVRKHLNVSTILSEMEAALQRSRKFELVTRRKGALKAVTDEQQFSASKFTAGNAAKMGKIQNAHYVVVPTIQDFKFYRSSRPVPNIANKYIRKDSGLLEINAQVIDTETAGVKATFYVKSKFATKDQVVNTKRGVPNSTHFTKMAKAVSAQMVDQLVDTVFPMRVLNVEGIQVWINRGYDGGLKAGDVLQIFRPGVELVDPDTGEKLGSAETDVGEVEVTRVNPKFTIAEIRGTPKKTIQRGDILRTP